MYIYPLKIKNIVLYCIVRWNLDITNEQGERTRRATSKVGEASFNAPLENEVFGITNDILRPRNTTINKKEPWYNETSL